MLGASIQMRVNQDQLANDCRHAYPLDPMDAVSVSGILEPATYKTDMGD